MRCEYLHLRESISVAEPGTSQTLTCQMLHERSDIHLTEQLHNCPIRPGDAYLSDNGADAARQLQCNADALKP